MDSIKLLDICKKIVKTKNLSSIYKKLIPVFENVGLGHESVSFLKKLWHITKDINYLVTAGDMYLNTLDDASSAFEAYDLFFQRTNPVFYMRYKYALFKNGYKNLLSEFDNFNYYSQLILLLDKYYTLGQIILYFWQYKNYDELLQAKEYLHIIKSQIESYAEKHSKEEYPWKEEMEGFNKYLASKLCLTEHNNNVNLFAVELNSDEKQAYLNIIDDYIENNNYDIAFDFYNKSHNILQKEKANTIPDMFWNLSNLLAENNYYYKSVSYQKRAIEYELANKEE